ncbi:SDR family NAD(P)-dependent oxidoreductase [Algirhabdus cladophorae]|uniref:SDR family NAD(P)-dependent oxidoreductase n=1 Tax=Algirhabdus cladophorae TaxID=3377108 RepID=UPI003B848078
MQVVITGASRGIGANLAQQYRNVGINVIGTSRNGGPQLHPLDVTDSAAIGALAQTITTPVDLLVCNAGVFLDRPLSLGETYDDAIWADSFATNVTGVFQTVHHFLPKLAPNAKIAIISSQMGSSERANGSSYVYRASKSAALNLGRNLAVDLAPKGIAVGIYHPGWVITDMGGANAAITPEVSAAGLIERFAALSLETTGVFEAYDGAPMPF